MALSKIRVITSIRFSFQFVLHPRFMLFLQWTIGFDRLLVLLIHLFKKFNYLQLKKKLRKFTQPNNLQRWTADLQ